MFLGRPQFAKYIFETHTSSRLSFDNSLLKGGPYFARQTRPFSQKSCFIRALNDFRTLEAGPLAAGQPGV